MVHNLSSNMTIVKENLKNLGLSDSEARVFELLLSRGSLGVSEIAKSLNLKRSTTYLYLQHLVAKDILVEEETKSKKLFKVVGKQNLEEIIKDRVKSLKELPDLISMLQSSKIASSSNGISVYRGKRGVLAVFNEIATFKGEVYGLGSLEGVSDFAGEKYYEEFYNKTRRKNLGVDYMISDWAKMTVKYFFQESGMFTKRRWLSPEIEIEGLYVIFGNKLSITKYEPEVITVLIEDKGLAEVLKLAYFSLWKDLEGKNLPLQKN